MRMRNQEGSIAGQQIRMIMCLNKDTWLKSVGPKEYFKWLANDEWSFFPSVIPWIRGVSFIHLYLTMISDEWMYQKYYPIDIYLPSLDYCIKWWEIWGLGCVYELWGK